VNRGHRPTRNNAPPVHSNSETKRSRRQSSTQCPFWAAAERVSSGRRCTRSRRWKLGSVRGNANSARARRPDRAPEATMTAKWAGRGSTDRKKHTIGNS
jgi:hypothetical protein